jgi:hypothetical protein
MVRRVISFIVPIVSACLIILGCGNPLLSIVENIHQRENTSDIVILQNDIEIELGSPFDFGSVPVGTNKDVVFEIMNTGKVDLVLNGSVEISGTDAAMFSIQAPPSSVIPPNTSSVFSIRFAPSTEGAKTATLTIRSNDPNEGEYTVTLTGTGTLAQISVRQGTTDIPTDGDFDMGNEEFGGWIDTTFEIRNLGTGSLSLTGSPDKVQVIPSDGPFSCTSQPTSPIAPSSSSTFVIRFNAGEPAGPKSATISIPNSDADMDPYEFEVTATAIQPGEPIMELSRGATGIPSGGSTDYGAVTVGDSMDVVFTITNSGTLDLHLDGTPYVSLSSNPTGQFTVISQPPSGTVAANGGTTTFSVRFAPTASGSKSATVSIANDSVTNPYTFIITGTGGLPEINVKQGSTSIPSPTGTYSFGSTLINTNVDRVFTIENLGNGTLNLTGNPKVAISGTHDSLFTVTAQPPVSQITPAGSTTFTIRFRPTSPGATTATVTVANDDSNENPYTFTINGTGTAPEINVKQGSTDISSGGSFNFGATRKDTAKSYTFTVENLGSADLHLAGNPRVSISGTGASMFSVTTQPAATIAPAASSNFTVRFLPTSYGSFTASVTIANDDSSESSYTFTITGTGNSLITVDSTGDVGQYVSIDSADYDNVYLAYNDQTSSPWKLKFTRSTDGGQSWPSGNIRTIDDCDNYIAMKRFAAYVFICYRSGGELKFAKSEDYGATWPAGNIKTLDSNGSTGYYISMALVFPNIYVSYYTWDTGQLKFIKSTDFGSSWSTPVVVDSATGYEGYYSSIGVDGSNVYISYQDYTNKDLKFAKSTDGGATWAPQTLNVPADDVGYYTSICVDGNYLYISFLDNTNKDLMIAKSTNAGWTWSYITVDSSGDAGWYTDIVDWNSGAIVMISYTTNGILKTAKSSDYGVTWTVKTVDSTVICMYTALTRYSNYVFLGYHDYTNGDLKFARSIDTGGTW